MIDNLVSIVTPLYNSEKFIEETINSVLKQTYNNWEMLIVDDCSIDLGPSIVKKYSKKDSRIKYIRMEKNRGAALCRNKAIELAEGEFIAFLDSDDLWIEKKLEKQIKFMKKNGYAITFHNYEQINEESMSLNKIIKIPKKPVTYKSYLLTNPIGCLSGMYSVKKIGKQYMPILQNREDTAFWLKLLKIEKYIYGIDENLAQYRVRKNSLSSKKIKLIKYHWRLYREIEKMSILESLLYLNATVLSKILRIK